MMRTSPLVVAGLLSACAPSPPQLQATVRARSALAPPVWSYVDVTLSMDGNDTPLAEASVPLGDFDLSAEIPGGVGSVTLTLTIDAAGSGLQLLEATEDFTVEGPELVWDVGRDDTGAFDTDFDEDGDDLTNYTEVFYGCDPGDELDCEWLQLDAGTAATCAIRRDRKLFCWGELAGQVLVVPTEIPFSPDGDDEWMQVSVGHDHACGITRDRRLYCFGDNWGGQLGAGESVEGDPIEAPTLPGSARPQWHMVSAGVGYTCAIDTERRLWCWGINDQGQLARNVVGPATAGLIDPGDADPEAWTSVVAGDQHVCGLQEDQLFCWGLNVTRQIDGLEEPATGDVLIEAPRLVPGAFRNVALGDLHTCASRVEEERTVCWGDNTLGQLGAAQDTFAAHEERYRALQAGEYHTCGIADDLGLRCWGHSGHGRTGQVPQENPVIPGGGILNGIEVAAGARHTCVRTPDDIVCFGANETGQLGRGETGTHLSPVEVVSLQTDWLGVTAGFWHTCAWGADHFDCFGRNDDGALGTGGHVGLQTAVAAEVAGNAVTSAAAGSEHTCVLDSVGLRCWGGDSVGQSKGLLAANDSDAGYTPPNTTSWTRVVAGPQTTCAMNDAADVAETLQCWGLDDLLQLGRTCSSGTCLTPGPYAHGLSAAVTDVAAGRAHTCAVDNTGVMACAGDWPIGGGPPGGVTTPVILGIAEWAEVSSGSDFICGIRNGRPECAGNNDNGQLGRGTCCALEPAFGAVSNANADWTTLEAGDHHVCGLRAGGELYCWGFNGYGQLGDGTDVDRPDPTPVLGSDTWLAVAAGYNHTCGVTTGNVLRCWGDNGEGQLGSGDAWDAASAPVVAP